MENCETSSNGKYCSFYEAKVVQRTKHEFCLNPRMHEINKVEKDGKLNCIGKGCGFAVCDKGNNEETT